MFDSPWGFQFTNKMDNTDVLIHTRNSQLFMSHKYMQIDLQLPTSRVYGLGERTHHFELGEGAWTMWATGRHAEYDDGSGGLQSSGVHPFALVQSSTKGQFMGIYFRNSNAMSPVIRKSGMLGGGSTLSYITIGGQLEMYFMFKGTAKEIIKQYQTIIGYPSLPPLYALGWYAGARSYTDFNDDF
jgi:alpha-glucosidase (family GH31 glycosyl hydrolase)